MSIFHIMGQNAHNVSEALKIYLQHKFNGEVSSLYDLKFFLKNAASKYLEKTFTLITFLYFPFTEVQIVFFHREASFAVYYLSHQDVLLNISEDEQPKTRRLKQDTVMGEWS